MPCLPKAKPATLGSKLPVRNLSWVYNYSENVTKTQGKEKSQRNLQAELAQLHGSVTTQYCNRSDFIA